MITIVSDPVYCEYWKCWEHALLTLTYSWCLEHNTSHRDIIMESMHAPWPIIRQPHTIHILSSTFWNCKIYSFIHKYITYNCTCIFNCMFWTNCNIESQYLLVICADFVLEINLWVIGVRRLLHLGQTPLWLCIFRGLCKYLSSVITLFCSFS